MKLKFFYLLVAIFGLSSFVSSCNDDDDDKTTTYQNETGVPTVVTKAFAAQYPEIDRTTVDWNQNGEYYVAEFKTTANMKDVNAWFTTSGTWSMSSTDLGKNLFLVSAEVNQTLMKEGYTSWTMDEITYYEYPAGGSNQNFYLFEVEKTGETNTNVYIADDGTLLKTTTGEVAEITPTTVI